MRHGEPGSPAGIGGEDVYFDNTRHEIGPEHILASAAIAPLFPPVEIGGRLLWTPATPTTCRSTPFSTRPRPRPRLHRDRPVRAAQPAAGDPGRGPGAGAGHRVRQRRPAEGRGAAAGVVRQELQPTGRGSGWCTWPTRPPTSSWRRRRSTSRRPRSGTAGRPGGGDMASRLAISRADGSTRRWTVRTEGTVY